MPQIVAIWPSRFEQDLWGVKNRFYPFWQSREQYFWWMLWWRRDLLAENQQFEVEILKVLNFQFIFRCKSVSIREMENKEPGKINLKSMKNILEMIFLIIWKWASEACSPPQSELIIFLATPNCCLQTVLSEFSRSGAACRPVCNITFNI